MSKQTVQIDALDVAKHITIQVRIVHLRQLWWRIKLACWLIILASRVAGFGGVEFEDSEDDEETQEPQA